MLRLHDGDELRFADTRKFGRFYHVAAGETLPLRSYAALGPEPLEDDFTPELFAARVAARRGNVKAALLDQRLVAGLGNIYVDEALFRARIHPRRTLQTLSADEVAALHEAIVFVLRRATGRGGTSFQRLPHHLGPPGRLPGGVERLPQRPAAPCPACGTPDRARRGRRPRHALLPALPGAISKECGFREEGRERAAVFKDGAWVDMLCISVLEHEVVYA